MNDTIEPENAKLLAALEACATVFDELDTVMWTNGCPVNYRAAQDETNELLNLRHSGTNSGLFEDQSQEIARLREALELCQTEVELADFQCGDYRKLSRATALTSASNALSTTPTP